MDICGHKGKSMVAVKMLKDTKDESENENFWSELNLMKILKPHDHVIQLLGRCTEGHLAMIVEYAPYADLLDFLRKSRLCIKKSTDETSLKSYLESDDLMTFMAEIASGMNHLADSKIIHRDLACRNVLVGCRRKCKIADLGLAYVPSGNGNKSDLNTNVKIPVKWSSPEVIFRQHWSTKSDVWSFGIVMWEILTIGGCPYPKYKSSDIPLLLRNSYRMEKPAHCSKQLSVSTLQSQKAMSSQVSFVLELQMSCADRALHTKAVLSAGQLSMSFEITEKCWQQQVRNRPDFREVLSSIQQLRHADDDYIVMNAYDQELYLELIADESNFGTDNLTTRC